MVHTLTLNPSIDCFMHLPKFSLSAVNRVAQTYLSPSGKGVNVSIVLKSLGVQNTAHGFVAGDTGAMFVSMFSKLGINYDFTEVEDGFTRINVKIQADTETEFNGSGPEIMKTDLDTLESELSKLSDGDILVLAGSLPPSLPSDTYARIISKFSEKNIRTIVDTTGIGLTSCLTYNPYMIKPNNIELAEIYGKSQLSREEIVECAKDLQNKGAQNVLVSMGSDGAILAASDGEVYFSAAPNGKVISTVGAGDSTVAGFIYAIENGFDFQNVLNFSVSAGSATAFSSGLATEKEIMGIYNENFR